jgi:hypothetical protein
MVYKLFRIFIFSYIRGIFITGASILGGAVKFREFETKNLISIIFVVVAIYGLIITRFLSLSWQKVFHSKVLIKRPYLQVWLIHLIQRPLDMLCSGSSLTVGLSNHFSCGVAVGTLAPVAPSDVMVTCLLKFLLLKYLVLSSGYSG